MTATRPLRVYFPCTGLGRQARGFEAFTRECAAALAGRDGLEITVFGGGGPLAAGERTVWNLPRTGGAARALGGVLGSDPYFIEQATFFAGFLPALATGAPDVVYFADLNLGNACWHWRRATGQSFKLLYYNGGATTKPFTRCDLVQQVSPEHLAAAIARGEPADRQVLLPHGVAIERAFQPASDDERRRCRAALRVPADGAVVLAAGALNISEKRLDYVIDEVASMRSRPHLLILGAETPEAPRIRAFAEQRLRGRCTIATVPREQMADAYRAADAFVLASLREGFGLAQVEALAAGLPCVVHDTPTTRYIVGAHGVVEDLRPQGRLAHALDGVLSDVVAGSRDGAARGAAYRADAAARHEWAWSRFSWDVLADRYAELLTACAAGRTPAFPEAT